jgi:NADPH:quinone reductase
MTDRIYPAETVEIWRGIKELWGNGLKPTVFEREYKGLEDVVIAMKDLSKRKVWGKAVVRLDASHQKPNL